MTLKPEYQQQALSVLKEISLFAGCTDEQFQMLAAVLQFQEYSKGKVILMEQEISKTLYILAQGKVGIWRRKGAEKTPIATLTAPDFFGETSMFTESAAGALVKAEENCRVFTLSRPAFDEVLKKFPAL